MGGWARFRASRTPIQGHLHHRTSNCPRCKKADRQRHFYWGEGGGGGVRVQNPFTRTTSPRKNPKTGSSTHIFYSSVGEKSRFGFATPPPPARGHQGELYGVLYVIYRCSCFRFFHPTSAHILPNTLLGFLHCLSHINRSATNPAVVTR